MIRNRLYHEWSKIRSAQTAFEWIWFESFTVPKRIVYRYQYSTGICLRSRYTKGRVKVKVLDEGFSPALVGLE